MASKKNTGLWKVNTGETSAVDKGEHRRMDSGC